MKVSIIGLGIMGAAMAKQLIAGGHEVTVYNRTRAKAAELLAAGATWVDTPRAASASADLVISMLTDSAAVIQVSFGSDGVLSALSADAVHAEMSTISPIIATELAAAYRESGRRYVQAPVLGSGKQIEDKALLVLAGGADADIDVCRPAWDSFAKRVWTFPEARESSVMKLACNTLASPMYASKGKSILADDFTPNFVVDNLLKDIIFATNAAREHGWNPPLNQVAQQLFLEAASSGLGELDYSAVVKVIARQAGIDRLSN